MGVGAEDGIELGSSIPWHTLETCVAMVQELRSREAEQAVVHIESRRPRRIQTPDSAVMLLGCPGTCWDSSGFG